MNKKEITNEEPKISSARVLRNQSEMDHEKKYQSFKKDLEQAINKNSMENYCNMPDFIIAEYLVHCFSGLCGAKNKNDKWHNRSIKEDR